MCIRHSLAVTALAVGIGSLIVPALAQQGGAGSTPDRGMSRMEDGGHMGHGMMSRDGMSGGMMGGGCAGMMQSMNGGDGRPNSQWQTHPKGGATPD